MKKFSKLFSLLLAVIMLGSLCACNNDNSDNKDITSDPVPVARLDYTNSGKKFNYFAYSSLFGGSIKYDADTTYEMGESYVTKERIQEYYDAGMGYMFPQTTALVGTNFSQGKAKQVMDTAVELGYTKCVVVTDNYLYTPYNNAKGEHENGSLKGETDWTKISCIGPASWQWDSEADLDAYVEGRLSQYVDHPAFAGVFLPDEPRAIYLNVVGEVYKSIRRVQKKLGVEDLYINANLLPYYPGSVDSAYPPVENSFHALKEQRNHEAYRRYLERFMEASDAEYLQADIYPMSYGEQRVYRNFTLNVQLMAEVAKAYDAKIMVVTQTTAFGNRTSGTKIVTYEDLNYLLNMIIGFGAENVGYFTYYTHEFDGTNVFDDNGSMMNMFGDRTPIYYYVQELNAKFQKLAPFILNFDYQASELYYGDDTTYRADFMDIADMYSRKNEFADFTKLTSYSLNKEHGIVTELYDEVKDNYMYMVFNSTSTSRKGSAVYQAGTLTFSNEYNKAYVFKDGIFKVYNLDENGSLTLKMHPGEAYYVMPYAS